MEYLVKLCRAGFSRVTVKVRGGRHDVRLMLTRLNQTQGPNQTPRTKPARPTVFSTRALPMLVFPVAAFALGTWQVKRYFWKTGLVKELESKTTMSPVPLPDDLSELDQLEYHPIAVRGQFDYSKEAYIGPRSNVHASKGQGMATGARGVWIVTPFKLSDRDMTIMVNRGWMSQTEARETKRRLEGEVHGEVELTGVCRLEEKRQPFMPKTGSSFDNGVFLYRNMNNLAEYLGTEPVFLDADLKSSVSGGPVGGQTRVQLRNEHLSYIATWYILAILGVYMCFNMTRSRGRRNAMFKLKEPKGE